MTQDLFVPASAEERDLIAAPIPSGTIWGVDWQKLKKMWLSVLSGRSIPAGGWALFMSVNTDHPKLLTGRRDFDLFLLSHGQHPVWSPRCTYRKVLSSYECPEWEEFSAEIDAFYREHPQDLPLGFGDDAEWFVDCMVNRIALDTLQSVSWRPDNAVGNHFLSPNTGQDIILSPLHPSGGQLFAATRGSTYEEAVNFSIMYAQTTVRSTSVAD